MTTATINQENSSNNSVLLPMLIIGGLFFMFGFVTWLNGSLIPFLQIACELNHTQAYLVTLVFYIAYTLMALPAARVLEKTGYKTGIVIGLFIMAIGALVFIPAAQTKLYSVFLIALFILGSGLTLLQTATNPFIVLIGRRETAAVRISIMGILNKSAGVIAPLVFTAWVLADMDQFTPEKIALLSEVDKHAQLQELSERLMFPYMLMAASLVVLAAFIKFSPLPEPNINEQGDTNSSNKSIRDFPHLILGVITLFLYVGAEVVAGDTIGLYGKEMGVENFAQLTSYTMAFMVVAYILGMVLIPRFISQEIALKSSAILGMIFTMLIILSSTTDLSVWNSLFFWLDIPALPNSVLFVALLGFSNALVWPAVWPMALKDLGNYTAKGSAWLIMGISGGAIIPVIYGVLADSIDSQLAYAIMFPCYAFIAYFAIWGHKKAKV